LGLPLAEGYGLTEAAPVLTASKPSPKTRHGHVGKPIPGVEIKIENADESGVGEVLARGPNVMLGYADDEEATKSVIGADGWLRTGDLARKGVLGSVLFAGRKKDVIKHGGYSVYALELERAIEEHPDVLEAAATGLPDDRKGEIPVAAVRLVDGASATPDELLEWVGERLADYKAPQRIVIVDELPRTGTNKVQKRELLAFFVE
jgi:acyl-CoA synthetase (AMP-forming)/AMP-acid ligase II